MSPSPDRYLHTGQHKYRINANRHPYLEWNSNPRSQRSSERKQFMPQTARPLWSARCSYNCGKCRHTHMRLSSHKVGYARCDVSWFLEWMDFVVLHFLPFHGRLVTLKTDGQNIVFLCLKQEEQNRLNHVIFEFTVDSKGACPNSCKRSHSDPHGKRLINYIVGVEWMVCLIQATHWSKISYITAPQELGYFLFR
jgi:hypothetical protein